MTEIIIAFLVGLLISFIFWGWIYHQHKKAWQTEYRRLMGGIEKARMETVRLVLASSKNPSLKEKAKKIEDMLFKLCIGDN